MRLFSYAYLAKLFDKGTPKRHDNVLIKGGKKPLIARNGQTSLELLHMDKSNLRFIQDFFTTLVDAKWRWTATLFFFSFILLWMFYGIIYYVIIISHASLDTEKQCLSNVETFTAAFMLSLETQHTIGYGFRYVTEECPEAVIALIFQSITGVMMQAFMVGVVFAKLIRPKKRLETILFSRKAVICMRDGKMCLVFRVGDMRKAFVIGATIKAQLIRKYTTLEGETFPFYMTEVLLRAEGGSDTLFFAWPISIIHEIDDESPLYETSAAQLLNSSFELVVYLDGISESTGVTIQARHSYLNSDILWGQSLNNIMSYDDNKERYEIDFSSFDSTTEMVMPTCSAKEMELFKESQTLKYNNNQLPQTSHTVVKVEPEYCSRITINASE